MSTSSEKVFASGMTNFKFDGSHFLSDEVRRDDGQFLCFFNFVNAALLPEILLRARQSVLLFEDFT